MDNTKPAVRDLFRDATHDMRNYPYSFTVNNVGDNPRVSDRQYIEAASGDRHNFGGKVTRRNGLVSIQVYTD